MYYELLNAVDANPAPPCLQAVSQGWHVSAALAPTNTILHIQCIHSDAHVVRAIERYLLSPCIQDTLL